jgi:citrate synthase
MAKHDESTRICGYDADSIKIRGRDLVADLMGKMSFTEMFLLQALGKEPSSTQIAIVDAVLVTIMEHGLVPSAVATRLTHHGAPESFQGAIAAGLLGVGAEIKSYRARKRPVPGFGHPIHVKADPRVPRLLEIARAAGAGGEHIATMQLVESCLTEELGKKLPVNISAAIAAVLGEAGVPARMMRGVVLTARCAGLVGHLLEEMDHPVAGAMWDAAEKRIRYEPPED